MNLPETNRYLDRATPTPLVPVGLNQSSFPNRMERHFSTELFGKG